MDRATGEEPQKEPGEGGERKDWTNEYLSSFKVAQYVTKEADQEEEEEDSNGPVEPEAPKEENGDPVSFFGEVT